MSSGQLGNIDWAISELPSQQAPYDQSKLMAGALRQSSYIA